VRNIVCRRVVERRGEKNTTKTTTSKQTKQTPRSDHPSTHKQHQIDVDEDSVRTRVKTYRPRQTLKARKKRGKRKKSRKTNKQEPHRQNKCGLTCGEQELLHEAG